MRIFILYNTALSKVEGAAFTIDENDLKLVEILGGLKLSIYIDGMKGLVLVKGFSQ